MGAERARGRVLVIVAHPDDPEFSCGGTVAKWVRQGVEVMYLICTNGDKGTADPALTSDKLAEIRAQEQRGAAERLGVQEVIFLGYPDAELVANLELRRKLVRYIRQFRPHTVITSDPTPYYFPSGHLTHPDHRAAGEAALAAVFPSARDRLYFPELLEEGLEPHRVGEVLLAGSLEPDYWVDITDSVEDKIAALREHKSQTGKRKDLGQRLRERAARVAQGKGMAYAEAFKRLTLS